MHRKAGGIMKAEIVVEGRVYFIAREAVFSLSPACSSKLQGGVQLPVSATQAGSTLNTEMTGGWGGRYWRLIPFELFILLACKYSLTKYDSKFLHSYSLL